MTARRVKTRRMTMIPTCSHCGQEVAETTKGNAYRHGFNRYKKVTMAGPKQFSQEDGRACEGSGEAVKYMPKTSTKALRRYK